jgi:hypothetical protein
MNIEKLVSNFFEKKRSESANSRRQSYTNQSTTKKCY